MIYVFTSAAINYLPKVRLLCASLKRYLPGTVVCFAVADEIPAWFDPTNEPIDEVIPICQLNIPHVRSWIFRHSLVELCTGIKPFVVQHLFARPKCEAVLYFDPDMAVFSSLDDLVSELRVGSILLTPHLTSPEQSLDAILDNEICSLRHGVYNLGFFGVKNDEEGNAFVRWWGDRLYHFCREGLEQGLWVDQKWIDLVPAFFESVRIARSSRFNVAPWNITTRTVTGDSEEGFLVDGEPLGFYHFTGFDSGAHEIMTTKYGGDNPAVMALVRWYKASIQTEDRARRTRWAFECFSTGVSITPQHRRIYRMRKDLQEAYPDPFIVVEDGQCYYNWFRWQAAAEHPEIVGVRGGERFQEDGVAQRNLLPRMSERQEWCRRLATLPRRAWSLFRRRGVCGILERTLGRRNVAGR